MSSNGQMKVEMASIAALEPDPANARKHSARNVEAIAGSLRQFGQRRPLVVYGSTVIAGNGTLEAARSLGWTEIAVTRVPRDWDYNRARAYALADNRTSELAEWNSDALAEQLLELDANGWDVSEFGFTPLAPPTNPFDEWTGMPDYEQGDKLSKFRVTVHFATDEDADSFFETIQRPRKTSMWWPADDGLVGSSVKHQYVTEE